MKIYTCLNYTKHGFMGISALLTRFGFHAKEPAKPIQPILKPETNMTKQTMMPLQTNATALGADTLADLSAYQPLTLANKAGEIHLNAQATPKKSS